MSNVTSDIDSLITCGGGGRACGGPRVTGETQVDLTEAVLPIRLLERRSLLEMFADFFTPPELFMSIADQKNPRHQMVNVKWRLLSFHEIRKESVAKKPYTPNWGEICQCLGH